MLPGALAHQPLQQGDLDDLCGLYATINAICIVMAPHRPLSDREIRKLTRAGVRYLKQRQMFAKTYRNGMTAKRQRKLVRALITRITSTTGAGISVERLFQSQGKPTQEVLLDTIEDHLQRGRVVIAGLQNVHDHFTVIVGASATRLYLADSDGLHWLPKGHVGPPGGKRSFRHAIRHKELICLLAA